MNAPAAVAPSLVPVNVTQSAILRRGTPRSEPVATAHIRSLLASLPPARLSGILCRHTPTVNWQAGRPDQHG